MQRKDRVTWAQHVRKVCNRRDASLLFYFTITWHDISNTTIIHFGRFALSRPPLPLSGLHRFSHDDKPFKSGESISTASLELAIS